MKRWIIFFGEDWGRHPSTGQFIAKELAEQFNILWINSLGLREPSLNRADLTRTLTKVRQSFAFNNRSSVAPEPAAEVRVLVPLVLPYHRFSAVRQINRAVFRRRLERALMSYGITDYDVVTASPASGYLLEQMKPRRIVYYCADEYSLIRGLNASVIRSLERQLLAKADVVVATSKTLSEEKAAHHSNVQYVPHGVDHALFCQALDAESPLPSKANWKYHVGFVGLLGEHIDLALLEKAAIEIPEARFILIGPLEESLGPLPTADNIVYLGPQPQSLLPRYLASMDVCVLPYALGARNKYANPTKVREYLAAGCPVVTTEQPEVRHIAGRVEIADSPEQFVALVRKNLKENVKQHARQISGAMADQTWSHRARQIAGFLA